MQSTRILYKTLVAITTSAFLVACGGNAASAYPDDVNNCNDSTLAWHFDGSSAWNSSNKNSVRAAFNPIDNALDYDGTKLISITESSSGIKVGMKSMGQYSYGVSECTSGASVTINSDFASSNAFLYKTARHEMLHLAGATHGGRYDSADGRAAATMSTCLSPTTYPGTNALEQDAAAYENFLHSSLSNRQLHANIGFEQGA